MQEPGLFAEHRPAWANSSRSVRDTSSPDGPSVPERASGSRSLAPAGLACPPPCSSCHLPLGAATSQLCRVVAGQGSLRASWSIAGHEETPRGPRLQQREVDRCGGDICIYTFTIGGSLCGLNHVVEVVEADVCRIGAVICVERHRQPRDEKRIVKAPTVQIPQQQMSGRTSVRGKAPATHAHSAAVDQLRFRLEQRGGNQFGIRCRITQNLFLSAGLPDACSSWVM